MPLRAASAHDVAHRHARHVVEVGLCEAAEQLAVARPEVNLAAQRDGREGQFHAPDGVDAQLALSPAVALETRSQAHAAAGKPLQRTEVPRLNGGLVHQVRVGFERIEVNEIVCVAVSVQWGAVGHSEPQFALEGQVAGQECFVRTSDETAEVSPHAVRIGALCVCGRSAEESCRKDECERFLHLNGKLKIVNSQ